MPVSQSYRNILALVKVSGKQIKRSLKTSDKALAQRRLADYDKRLALEEFDEGLVKRMSASQESDRLASQNQTLPQSSGALSRQETRQKSADLTFKEEARRNQQGRLRVYPIPPGDGGGKYEVAGINDGNHLPMFNHLKALIESGQHAEAEKQAKE